MRYEEYLKLVYNRLLRDKFTLEKAQVADFSLDLFAISPVYGRPVIPYVDGINPLLGVGPYWLTFAIISLPSVTVPTIENYSKNIYDHTFNKVTKSRFFHRIVLPIVVSEGFSDELKSFVSSYNGIKMRYPTVDTIHPVLIDLASSTICYNSKVTVKYSRTKKIAKEAIEKYLFTENMTKLKN